MGKYDYGFHQSNMIPLIEGLSPTQNANIFIEDLKQLSYTEFATTKGKQVRNIPIKREVIV